MARTVLTFGFGVALGWLARAPERRSPGVPPSRSTNADRASGGAGGTPGRPSFNASALASGAFIPPSGLSTIEELSQYWQASEKSLSDSIGTVYLRYGGNVGSDECQRILAPLQDGFTALSENMQATIPKLAQVNGAVARLRGISDGMNKTAQEMRNATNMLQKAQELFSGATSILNLVKPG